MMRGQLMTTGVQATLRSLLVHFPEGATTAQLIAAGQLSMLPKRVSGALSEMRNGGQVASRMTGRGALWKLTPRTLAVARKAGNAALQQQNAADHGWPSQLAPVADDFASTTAQKKARESAKIAEQLAEFQRHGGRIEVLGNTPLRKQPSYRASQTGLARNA